MTITYGKLLRQARLDADLTQAKLANEIGCAPSYVSGVECERFNGHFDFFTKAATALNMTYDELLQVHEEIPSPESSEEKHPRLKADGTWDWEAMYLDHVKDWPSFCTAAMLDINIHWMNCNVEEGMGGVLDWELFHVERLKNGNPYLAYFKPADPHGDGIVTIKDDEYATLTSYSDGGIHYYIHVGAGLIPFGHEEKK